jgi:iron complex outermembrane receptor protein
MNKKSLKQQLSKQLIFSQWSRKSFAVFASLKSVVNIGVLSGTLSILAIPEKGHSQTDTIKVSKHLDIDEVVVAGERSPEVYSKVSRVVTLVPKEAALRTPAQNLVDLLEYSPGIDLRVRGKHGVQADLNIRGGSFDQNVILLNGINISNPQTGHLSLTLPIDIESIEQVEILEGPSSRITGANAFSGAVNFVTNTDTINRVDVHGMYGEYNLYKTNVTASLSNNYIRNFVAFSVYGSDGFTHNTDFKSYNLYYNGDVKIKEGKLCFQLGMTDKAYGSNNFYSTRYKDQFEENTASLASVNFQTGTNLKLNSAVYWNRLYDHFVLIRDIPEAYQNFHVTDVVGTNQNASFLSILGKTTFGVDLRSESIHSNNLGFPTNDTILVPGQDSIYYTKFDSRANAGLFIEQTYHSQNFSVSGGGVFNFNTAQGLQGKFYPGIDLSYRILDALKIYASVNSSVRMPTFTDLFYVGPENVGNPNLKPEEAITYELGVKSAVNYLMGNASVFYRQGKNIIDWNKQNASDAVWTPSNITDLNTLGIELQGVLNTATFAMNPTFGVRSVQLGGLFLDQTISSNNTISRYALDYLKQKITAGVDIRLFKRLYTNWQTVFEDRNGDYQAYNTELGASETKEYKPFVLVDAKVYYEHKMLMPYIEVSNIFDTDYNDIGGVPQPGRWIRGGIKVNLEFN